jgi:ABC-type transport system involved in cytochrome bd biosynthesis fused ATPase/permease subunit
LFAPIVKFVEEYKDALKDYPIEFDATFAIRGFEDYFFDFVNQQIAGSFYGKEQGLMRVKDNIENINLLDLDSIIEFPSSINEVLQYDKRDGANNALRNIEAQLKKGHTKQDLYDYIYSMDYIVPFFQLKMNGKPLSSLSPGERGALLLLLYLFIDMDDKPLIIDQPEENLDNESVYKYIVHFIKEAKRRRQIIMVTHNPNLAVVCDADQIIQMKIDKQNGNTVSYESGAIENPTINKIIVDILEGTYPAFHNRDSKYFDKIV